MLLLFFACSDHDLKYLSEESSTGNDTGIITFTPSDEPDIYIDPPLVDFGGIMKDCPSDWLELTIENRGMEDLIVSEIELAGEDFSLSAFEENSSDLLQTQDLVLPFGEQARFQIRFTPEYFLNYEADLKIKSNDPDQSLVEVPTIGKGTAGPQIEESFTQNFNEKVDVLWVIDNSPSMEDNIQHVQQSFQSFLDSFLNLGLDYQMSIITTDPDQNGIFQGSPTIMTSSDSASVVTQQFTNTLSGLGTDGAFWEEGLQVVKDALSNQAQRQQFLRGEDAGLSVIIVSDEDDNTSPFKGQPFINWFGSLKSDPTLARVHGFLNLSVDDGSYEGNPTYDEVIAATNGHTADIEGSAYETALEQIGYASAGMIVSYTLQDQPYPFSSISVEKGDGTVVQQGANSWTYNSSTNVVEFSGDGIPEFGETIVITYEIEGECQN